ncbi:MAG: prepilin-type N-terminal cleavage/methylation domain-containing protein [Rhodocyclaceae bacterium]|nr:prepilin-type N-terminal cleavage/methylation domain-containing protein [Rhodocyclaceae bacterium]
MMPFRHTVQLRCPAVPPGLTFGSGRSLRSLHFAARNEPPPKLRFARGFTLTEMAVVLVIVALLLGGMLMPISAQQDIRYVTETQKQLADITEALHGYAASHAAGDSKPYLPCPDTDGDGAEDRSGSACANQEGTLPWADIGLGRLDAWNNALRYRVAAAFSSNAAGFTLSSAGDLRVCESSACATVIATALPVVILSRGKNGAAIPAGADEMENADGDTDFVQHTQTSGYDDLVIWLSPNILFNRMISAGRLP